MPNPATTPWVPSERLHVRSEFTVVHVIGDVDAATAPHFRRALMRCDDDPVVLALDLSRVSFFAAAGVHCFVDLGWPTRPHACVIASRSVRRVLEVCDLGFLLELHGWVGAFDGWSQSDGGVRSDHLRYGQR